MSSAPTPLPTAADAPPDPKIEHLGLIAGEGDFPLLVARAARSRSVAVTAVALIGLASPEIEQVATTTHWIKFGKVDQVIKTLQASGARHVIMVGRVPHNQIFKLANIDVRGVKLLARLANKKADTVLATVVEEFARENLEVVDSSIFLRDCMPPAGLLTPNVPPTDELMRDFEFGIHHAKSIAGLDIGQSILVKSQTVVAVEAMEGTDATIERAGRIGGPGAVLCKVAKPQQDNRFDIPLLGLKTIQMLVEAKAAGLAFPGGEVLFFDRDEAVALAEANGICIYAV